MAIRKNNASDTQPTSTATAESDYGSDIDEETWNAILSQVETQPLHEVAITSIEESQLSENDATEITQARILRVARIEAHLQAGYNELRHLLVDLEGENQRSPSSSPFVQRTGNEGHDSSAVEAVTGKDLGETASDTAKRERESSGKASGTTSALTTIVTEEAQQSAEDTVRERSVSVQPGSEAKRSPLERFRTSPKKPLSVTDIISPAWCELQYWYSLTKYGRVRKTPAMKQGSKIHKEKEREVHTEVPVETSSREDRFALRLWNMIAGLRTLRLTGLTRELEIMGLVEGEVVIGIIDEISHTCPDEEMEELVLLAADEKDMTMSDKKRRKKRQKKKTGPAFPADQPTMKDFFVSSQESNDSQVHSSWLGTLQREDRSLYLVDIKTRRSHNLPPSGSQMRPTRMQLMMYRRILIDLATDNVDATKIFDRYSLDSSKVFSDTFIASMSGVLLATNAPASTDDEENAHDPVDEVISHNTLGMLWPFMISELARTIPASVLSPLLTAEYRASDTGEIIGKRSFAFNADELDPYVESEMRWWRGQREVRGVDIEEAYKCSICEFADKCDWRINKVEEAASKAKARRTSSKAHLASAG